MINAKEITLGEVYRKNKDDKLILHKMKKWGINGTTVKNCVIDYANDLDNRI